MSAKSPKENFKFSDVLAVAYASQRYNKKYIRETSGYAGYEGMEVKPIQIANKQIMRFALSQNNNGIIPQAIDILKRANIQVTEEDQKNANETCEWLEGLSFKALAGDLNNFEENLYQTFEKEVVTTYDFGLIASIPQTYLRTVKRENLEDRIVTTCTGDWVGSKGQKVNVKAELVSGVYSRNYGSYIYVAITESNQLITFWSQHNWITQVGNTVNIYAKVKRTDISKWFNGVKESQLNYVKIT
jgi:hypothetical protein